MGYCGFMFANNLAYYLQTSIDELNVIDFKASSFTRHTLEPCYKYWTGFGDNSAALDIINSDTRSGLKVVRRVFVQTYNPAALNIS